MKNQSTRRGFTQIAVNKNGHENIKIIPELVSGSSTHAVMKQQALKTLKRFQGLSNFTTARGFTLIELLVVVLIIGILAAVAVPQYQKAVNKSRFATLIPLVKTVANAKSEHYLATGEWARKFEVLSIALPKDFIITDDADYGQRADNAARKQTIRLDAKNHQVVGQIKLADNSSLWYYMPVGEFKASTQCAGRSNSQSDQLCKSLSGATFISGPDNASYNWYNIL